MVNIGKSFRFDYGSDCFNERTKGQHLLHLHPSSETVGDLNLNPQDPSRLNKFSSPAIEWNRTATMRIILIDISDLHASSVPRSANSTGIDSRTRFGFIQA